MTDIPTFEHLATWSEARQAAIAYYEQQNPPPAEQPTPPVVYRMPPVMTGHAGRLWLDAVVADPLSYNPSIVLRLRLALVENQDILSLEEAELLHLEMGKVLASYREYRAYMAAFNAWHNEINAWVNGRDAFIDRVNRAWDTARRTGK